MSMDERIAIVLFVLLSNVHWDPLGLLQHHTSTILLDCHHNHHHHLHSHAGAILLAEAKGVAGLGKAGGEGQGGADKAGQQVPPEVYMALTYAGTLFLFTLSVPLILYGLNKLLNKIEDCFGCGPSSRAKNKQATGGGASQSQKTKLPESNSQMAEASKSRVNGRQQTALSRGESDNINGNHQAAIGTISGSLDEQQHHHQDSHNQSSDESNTTKQYHQNQRLHLQMLQQYPKYTQFISMSSPEYDPKTATAVHADHSSSSPPLAPGNAYPVQQSGGSPALRHKNNSYAPHSTSSNLNSMTRN